MALPDDRQALDEVAASLRALGHPTRLQILAALTCERALSPTQLLERVPPGTGLPNVAYHTRTLASSGLLLPAGRRPARGALEHFYRLSARGRALIDWVERLTA